METRTYRIVNVAQILQQSFPLGDSSNSVKISIYDVDDSAQDVSVAAMTFVTGVTWKYSWTPTENHMFLIDYYNETLDSHYYEYCQVAGELVGVPGGAGVGSTLTVLQKSVLLGLDNYNPNDLTGDGSSGDQATRSINKALQKIYSLIKDSKFMQAYGSTSLASVASQDYIALSAISDLDEVVSVLDTSNNITLQYIEPWKYFQTPNPANVTGVPFQYTRIFNRIYLRPRPTAVITYTTQYRKTYADLSAGSDVALIPSKYNYWILAEAMVEWKIMEDPNAVPAILLSERDKVRDIAMMDILSEYNKVIVSDSHWGSNDFNWRGFESPIDGT